MKRGDLLRHLRKHGCHMKREGRSHSLWTNPATTGAFLCRGRPVSLANKPGTGAGGHRTPQRRLLSAGSFGRRRCPGARRRSLMDVHSKDRTLITCRPSGTGPPVVLVHGTTDDGAMWEPLLPVLERHRTVYPIDRRGRGGSGDTEPGTARTRVGRYRRLLWTPSVAAWMSRPFFWRDVCLGKLSSRPSRAPAGSRRAPHACLVGASRLLTSPRERRSCVTPAHRKRFSCSSTVTC